ncbi:RagB/SusD family nutrient uptake outer membrane protein [Tunicatimonas pelagia]|uniref:RagB/SusD family nutrient uptake outer membrane protein n=1 Tax=Tunicatimonas pelagia TaxID=931531 RepID=UPI0026668007|nr:RagB/SusD family nutrient uptake outer membrane protein [Tunicatimonas pelagia]WKN44700.1 RagB/SusD family nutrient uptake outer membrane protein [Tunicatimonas pelagia]
MKTHYIHTLTLILILLLGVNACNILEEDPEHLLVTDNFYQSEGDAVAAVNTIYNRMYTRMYERSMQLMVDLPTDDYKNGQGMNNPFLIDLEFLRITTENQFVAQIWQDHYDGINRANTLINRAPDIDMDEELKNRLIAEARFLRGLFYFNLVRFYGDVPIILEDTQSLDNLNVTRDPADQVYQQLISDLMFATDNLPISYLDNQTGRATQGAAKALLGKVYLTQQDWANAGQTLGEIVNNEAAYGYGLHENFADNWNPITENGMEAIFSAQFMQDPGNGNILMRSTVPRSRVPGLVGWEADIPTQEVYDLFEEEDERRAVTFYTSYEQDGEMYEFPWPLFYKYFDPSQANATNQSNANIHILRYADVLLMYAEALNEQGGPTPEAYEAINRVRRRAHNDTDHNLTGLSQADFRDAVYLERRLELVMETHRWFDLVRTGRFVEVMQNHDENGGTSVQAYNVLMPIPQREIDTNPNLTQNTGY